MGPALGGFAKALAWFFGAIAQGLANVWDRLTHHATREAEQIVDDESEDGRGGSPDGPNNPNE